MFTRRLEGNVIVLTCERDVSVENLDEFRREFREQVDSIRDGDRLVLDLSRLEHIASTALGLIAASYPKVRSRGGQMRIVASSDELLRLLRVTRLSRVFRIDSDLATAVDTFK